MVAEAARVRFEKSGHVATLILDRPQVLNAFDRAMYAEFDTCMARVRDDDSVRVAVVTGAGERAFSAGVDIKALDSDLAGGNADGYGPLCISAGMFTDKPIIAAVEGHCIGEGFALVLSCDIVIAAESARFSVPEARIGVNAIDIPLLLARRAGYMQAFALLADGRPRSAAWCLDAGLAALVTANGEALPTARELAVRIAGECAPLAVRAMKSTLHTAVHGSHEAAREIGARSRAAILESADFAEGRVAFASKRRPVFSGR